MSVRKKCAGGGCPHADARCAHTWVAEFQRKLHGVSTAFVIRVDDYAALRGTPDHVKSERGALECEGQMIADVRRGVDPRKPPTASAAGATVASVIATYTTQRAPRYRVQATVLSELHHIGAYFGARPMADLADVSLVRSFETALTTGWRPDVDGQPQPPLPHGRGLIAVNRILARLRHVLRWAVPEKLFTGVVPFHEHGVKIDTEREATRDRRLQPGEWEKLIRACVETDTKGYRYAGRQMLRRLVAEVEIGVRATREILNIRVVDIDFDDCVITLPARNTKTGKPRRVPYDPNGELAIVLQSRRHLQPGPNPKPGHETDYVFGDEDGRRVQRFSSAFETVLLVAFGPRDVKRRPLRRSTPTGRAALRRCALVDGQRLQFRDLRREAGSRWNDRGVDLKTVMELLGHGKLTTTQKYLSLNDGKTIAARLAPKMGWSKPAENSAKTPPNADAAMLRSLRVAKG